MTKINDLNTAEEFHHLGKYYYNSAADMEDISEPQEKIDASWKLAAANFWQALTLGSTKAPLDLFKCFIQGVGVKKDDDIATLMYGAALQLIPEDCAKIPDNSKPVIPNSMKPRIVALVKLVKDTHSKIPAEGVTIERMFDQMDKFNHAIKLPFGKLIESCFTEKITEDSSKAKEFKSKALDLTKNLLSHSNTTTITKSKPSKKSNNAASRTGYSIYK